jgi:hypothetical protein
MIMCSGARTARVLGVVMRIAEIRDLIKATDVVYDAGKPQH